VNRSKMPNKQMIMQNDLTEKLEQKIIDLEKMVKQLIIQNDDLIKKNNQLENINNILPYVDTELNLLLNQLN